MVSKKDTVSAPWGLQSSWRGKDFKRSLNHSRLNEVGLGGVQGAERACRRTLGRPGSLPGGHVILNLHT